VLATAATGQGFTPINLGAPRSGEKPAKTSGQKLVAEAARRVFDEAAIAADLRYKIDAFGHELVGTGRYLQLGAGADKLLRLELKMQVAGKPATLQEICGPDTYWIRRDVPPAPATLGRVDLRTIRQSLAASLDEPRQIMPSDGWIMLGGLPRLLASLEKSFEFGPADAQNLEFTGEDGLVQRLPIWVVEGRWKPGPLGAVAGKEAKKLKPGELPEQLPDLVRLTLGRTSDVLPLFPYRVTYLRMAPPKDETAPASGAGQGSTPPVDHTTAPRELLTLELFNVHRKGDIDQGEFDYNPANQQVQDLTTAWVNRFGGEKKSR
jgi:hypothetical protein